MTTAQKITQAPNPQAALLVLAQAIDEVLARLDSTASADAAWGDWQQVTPAAPATPLAVERTPQRDEARIAALKERLATEHDPDERRALEAQLRLADETGIIPAEDYAAAGTGAHVTHDQATDEVLVELPPPDPERLEARYAWAKQVKLGDLFTPRMDVEQAAIAYAKGGPLWLYHGNDELARSFPPAHRRMMVADIEVDSPRTAQEVARDLLKADADEALGDKPASLGALAGELV